LAKPEEELKSSINTFRKQNSKRTAVNDLQTCHEKAAETVFLNSQVIEKQIFREEIETQKVNRKYLIIYPEDRFKTFWEIYMTM
jgi:hypothetical protein